MRPRLAPPPPSEQSGRAAAKDRTALGSKGPEWGPSLSLAAASGSQVREDFSGRKPARGARQAGLRCSWDLSCPRSVGVFPRTSSQRNPGIDIANGSQIREATGELPQPCLQDMNSTVGGGRYYTVLLATVCPRA